MSQHYYIPATAEAPFAAMGEMLACRHCKRKILVEMGINGTIHHMGTSVVCADCLEIREEFRTKFPDITRQIEEWKNDKGNEDNRSEAEIA